MTNHVVLHINFHTAVSGPCRYSTREVVESVDEYMKKLRV